MGTWCVLSRALTTYGSTQMSIYVSTDAESLMMPKKPKSAFDIAEKTIYVSTMAIASSIGSFSSPPICKSVDLSTVNGARCQCGKFKIGMAALPLNTMSMTDVRQVVASGFKLVHGSPMVDINWRNPVF